ncbi:HD domain-containing phosphohydrolase [Thermodesulfobacteriota bacterium]
MAFNSKKSNLNGNEALLVECLKDSYFFYSCQTSGEVTFVSTSVSNVLGYEQEEFLEFINKSGHYFSMHDRHEIPSKDSLRGNRAEPYEIQLPHKNGAPCWLEITEFPMCDDKGKVEAVECILHNITDRKRAELGLQTSVEKLRKALAGTIQAMALTVETRDAYTAGHQRRVTNLARSIAQEMGLTENEVDAIRMAGVIHDLGKISVPAEILSKPGRLSPLEFSLIKIHPQTGYDILKGIDFQWPIASIVLQHHERLDGSGYPQGITETEIMKEAKILAVADVVEAMSSHRPYRATLGIDAALDEVTTNKNILFDAQVVDTAVDLITKKDFHFDHA